MTILFATDNFLPAVNGITTYVTTTTKELRKRDHRVIILAPSWPGFHDTDKDVIRMASFPVVVRPGDRTVLPYAPKIERKLLAEKIDIIHSHLFATGLLAAKVAKVKKIPQVLTYHTSFKVVGGWMFPWAEPIVDKLAPVLNRWALNRYDVVIAPSQKIQRELQSAKVKSKIVLIQNGIDLDLFSKAKAEPFLQKFPQAKNSALLVIVGKLDPGKNVELALKAVSALKIKIPNIKLAIIGDGVLRRQIEKTIKDLNLEEIAFITGFLDRHLVASAQKAAMLDLFLSEIDNFPIAALEAISAAKSVVAIEGVGLEDLVQDSRNGFLVNKSPKAVAVAVSKILQDSTLAQKFARASLKIAQNYSIEKHVDQIEALYRDLIKKAA